MSNSLPPVMSPEKTEGETYNLFTVKEDNSPWVTLEVEGVRTDFVVDTGCQVSKVMYEQVKIWGIEDKIVCDDEGLPYVPAFFGVLGGTQGVVDVRNHPWNLLGLDFLHIFNCVLDLKENKLTVRKFQRPRRLANPLMETLTINGKKVRAQLDTGTVDFLSGTMKHAEELGLDLKDVSGRGYSYRTLRGLVPIDYEAYDVCARGCGQQKSGTFSIGPERESVLVGQEFLEGITIHFYGNNEYVISYPGYRSKTRELRRIWKSLRRSVREASATTAKMVRKIKKGLRRKIQVSQ